MIVDVILVLIVLIGMVIGFKLGFVGIIAKPVKFFASLGLAFGLCKQVGAKFIMPNISGSVTNYVSNFIYENCSMLTAENAADEMPTLLKIAAAIFNIDVATLTADGGKSFTDTLAQTITEPVVSVISVAIAFVAVYIVASICLSIILLVLKSVFSNGVFGLLNKLVGFVFGTAFSVLLAWGVAVVFEYIIHLPSFASYDWVADFEGWYVYKFFNSYNPIELLLSF